VPVLCNPHQRLTATEVKDALAGLLVVSKSAEARDMLFGVISEVSVVERWPAHHPVWARAEVIWTPEVQTLLDADLLRLK
jgi:hypothetical protein